MVQRCAREDGIQGIIKLAHICMAESQNAMIRQRQVTDKKLARKWVVPNQNKNCGNEM